MAGMSIRRGRIEMLRRLDQLLRVHLLPVEKAHEHLASEVPVYTRAYSDSIGFFASTVASEVSVSLSILINNNALVIEQSELDDQDGGEYFTGAQRVFANIHGDGVGPDGPYPLRIEAHGGPTAGKGQGMWQEAEEILLANWMNEINRVAQGKGASV